MVRMTDGNGLDHAGSVHGNRAPRVAEVVAGELRRQITEGELGDGALLPKQEELIAAFGVSRPSVREALGILEAEGLISVRRGNRGGAVVHRPRVDNVAYMFGLVLKSNQVAVNDVGEALRRLEPICTAGCALRPDREQNVLPRLRLIHEESKQYVDDPLQFAPVYRRFHEELVACSDNDTIILLIGALERIYSAYATVWAEELSEGAMDPTRDYRQGRQRAIDDHELFLRLIERGDADAVEREARAHLAWASVFTVRAEDRVVSLLQSWSEEE
jgi:DNA-binding FadR family transcriptional regulator